MLYLLPFTFSSPCFCRGLFKTDRAVGTAQLKLEALENHCEIREIIEVSVNDQMYGSHKHLHRFSLRARVSGQVMDGRKATGGKLEVRVKIREPLSGVDLQPMTEKWFVLEPVSPLSPPERQKERVSSQQFARLDNIRINKTQRLLLHALTFFSLALERISWRRDQVP